MPTFPTPQTQILQSAERKTREAKSRMLFCRRRVATKGTIERKKTGDSPLLETGELRGSIEREVHEDVAYVGTNDKKAEFQEFGTSRIPPRPFLAGAAAAKHAEIGELIGKYSHSLLTKKA
jgi:phage gpG-like protein